MKKTNIIKIKSRRKNFLPALILSLIFWGAWIYLIFWQPPANYLLIFSFYLLLFFAGFFSLSLIWANSKIGFLNSLWLILFLTFRYFKIGNSLNLGLLTLIFSLLIFYFYQKNRPKKMFDKILNK